MNTRMQQDEGFQFHCSILPPMSPPDIISILQVAQEDGFDRVWIPDETFHCDPFVLLAEAARVSDLPLGLAVTNPFTRHPVQIARAIAGLRHLRPHSDWAFAIGASNPRRVLKPLGMEMRNSAYNIGESVRVIRELLRGDTVTRRDSRLSFSLENVRLDIDPVDDVDILVGSRGPRTLQQAGRFADAAIVESLFTPEAIAWASNQIATGLNNRDDRHSLRYIAWQVTEITDDDQTLPENIRDSIVMLMRTTHRDVLQLLGFSDDLIATIKSSQSAEAIPGWTLRKFAAIGSASDIRKTIDAAADAGANAWSCTFTGTPGQITGRMDEFATAVMQPLRNAWRE